MANIKISELPSATIPLSGNEEVPIVQEGQTVKVASSYMGVPSYKVYTALLTQSGGNNVQGKAEGDILETGVTYLIVNIQPGVDLSFFGAPNNEIGTYFICTNTGICPDAALEYNTGAPTVIVLENTIGDIWFTYEQDGYYFANSNGLFTLNKTFCKGDTNTAEDGTGLKVITVMRNNANRCSIASTNPILEAPNNDLLFNTPIEIRVYN